MRATMYYKQDPPQEVDLDCYCYCTRNEILADLKIMLGSVLGSFIAIRTREAHIAGIIDRVDESGTVWIRTSYSGHTYQWVWCWLERIDKLTLPDPNRAVKSLDPNDYEALVTQPLRRLP